MTLPEFSQPVYIARHRCFIDSSQRDAGTLYEGQYALSRLLQNVVSIQMVSYNLPRDMMPTFVASGRASDGSQVLGNNMLDVRVTDIPVTETVTFSLELPVGRFENAASLRSNIIKWLNKALNAAGNATLNTTNGYSFFYDSTTDPLSNNTGQAFFFPSFGFYFDAYSGSAAFLFGSGPNAAQSAWKVLGFPQNTDVGGPDAVTGNAYAFDPVPARPMLLSPFQYVDVYVDVASEKGIVYRIFVQSETASSAAPAYTVKEERLDTTSLLDDNPPRQTTDIRVTLKLEGNAQVPVALQKDYDLVFDILFISTEIGLPKWMRQRLVY